MDRSNNIDADKVEELTNALNDVIEQDSKLSSKLYLAHWLKAHKHDVEKTGQAIRINLQWRKQNRIDDLLYEDVPKDISQKFPMFLDVKGRAGNPVVYGHVGALDICALCKEFGKDRLVRYISQFMVKMEQISFEWDNQRMARIGDLPTDRASGGGYFGIYDAANFSMKNAASMEALQFYVEWVKMGMNYFPSCTTAACLINASKLVEIPYRLVKPLLQARGYQLTVLGTDETEWEESLFAVIEPRKLKELQEKAKSLMTGTWMTTS